VRGPRAQGGPGRVPRGPKEGSQKESGPGKGCKGKGKCNLILRKRKKIRKKNQSKGVLRVIGGPRKPLGAKKGALLSPRRARVGQNNDTKTIAVLNKGRKKEK
jgi:hypothetical protein